LFYNGVKLGHSPEERSEIEGVLEQVLGRISGSIGNGVTRTYRKLHNDELHNLYSAHNTAMVIKSKRVRQVGHLVVMEETRETLVGKSHDKKLLQT